MNENAPGPVENFDKQITMVKAAFKSGQAETKGFDTIYFADHECLLGDGELADLVAKQYPYTIGHLHERNKDRDFVIRWFSRVDPDKVKAVQADARGNSLRIYVSDEEIEKARNTR